MSYTAEMPLNMTPKRLAALRYIQQHPGCLVRELVNICNRRDATWRSDGATWSGFDRAGTGTQAATRWGSAYARPLSTSGLLEMRPATPGGFRLYLTEAGRDAIERAGGI